MRYIVSDCTCYCYLSIIQLCYRCVLLFHEACVRQTLGKITDFFGGLMPAAKKNGARRLVHCVNVIHELTLAVDKCVCVLNLVETCSRALGANREGEREKRTIKNKKHGRLSISERSR